MQNLNLRFDKNMSAASVPLGSTDSLGAMSYGTGLKPSSSVKNDSSFLVALENARKQLDNPVSESTSVSYSNNISSSSSSSSSAYSSSKSESVDENEKVVLDEVSESEISAAFSLIEEEVSEIESANDFDFSVEEIVELIGKGSDIAELGENLAKPQDDNQILSIDFFQSEKLNENDEENLSTLSDSELVYAVLSKKSAVEFTSQPVENKNSDAELLTDEVLSDEKDSSLDEIASLGQSEILKTSQSNEVLNDVLNSDFAQDFDLASENIDNAKIQKDSKNPVISVVDERTVNEKIEHKSDNFVTSIEKTGNGEVEMSMNLSSQAQNNISFEGTSSVGFQQADSSRFASLLSQQLQGASSDFVKAGNLVLKDGNKGSINLILHPDDLGNVKIQLEVTDKLISGKIVVATKEAFEAFNQNLNNLKNAFAQSGFEGASFDLSWSGQEEQKNSDGERNFYANIYQNNVPESFDASEVQYESLVAYEALMYGSSRIDVLA